MPCSDGLMMSTPLGARWIPYTAMRSIRSVEIQANGRYVVWIDSVKGLPLHGLLASLLFGRWLWRGFLLTSDLNRFDQILAAGRTTQTQIWRHTIRCALCRRSTNVAPIHDERTVYHDQQVIARDELAIDQRTATWHMISASASLALPAVVSGIIQLQFPWIAFVIPLLALIEFPLASFVLERLANGYSAANGI